MIRQNYGRIVNIASIAGKDGNANAAHYSASKAGLIATDKVARQGTRRLRNRGQRGDPRRGQDRDLRPADEAAYRLMLSKIPKGRFVLGGRTRGDVAWLALGDCAFSTGAVFDISGGRATY